MAEPASYCPTQAPPVQAWAPHPTPVSIRLTPGQVVKWLTLATVGVIGACVLVTSLSILTERPSLFGAAQLFDLNRETSIPAYYSGLLLLSAAVLLAVAAAVARISGDAWWAYWVVLATGFVFLSFDEIISIHEKFSRPLRHLLGASAETPAWVIAGALAALVVGILFIPFLRNLPFRHASRFTTAGAVYVGSAVGVELFTNVVHGGRIGLDDAYDWLGLTLVAVEETGEMAGAALFIRALVDYLHSTGARVDIAFEPTPARERGGRSHPARGGQEQTRVKRR